MERKMILGIMLSLLLMAVSTSVFNFYLVKAAPEIIHIRADGSVDPSDAPISSVDNVTYTFTDNIYDKIVVERNNITLDGIGYTLQGPTEYSPPSGIELDGVDNVTIQNMNIEDFDYGVYLNSASNIVISGNNITNNGHGVEFFSANNNNTVSGNNINNGGYGVWFYEANNNNTIFGNNITNNSLEGVSFGANNNNNTVSGNNVTNNYHGLSISPGSNNNTVSGNNVANNSRIGVNVFGSFSIISGNNVTNNNELGVFLGDHAFSVVSENIITNNYDGIRLVHSSNNTVSGNNITNNNDGVQIFHSSNNNTVSGNNITNNNDDGVYLLESNNNAVFGNNITNNSMYGVQVAGSNNTIVFGNNITINSRGIYLFLTSDNKIYHNNFIDNIIHQAYISNDEYTNTLDDGFPSGGNYWSDYEESYPDAEELDGSGIWDTQYYVDQNHYDNYPLMNPWSAPRFTIEAHCYTEGVDVGVSITRDGEPTGYYTPHTFVNLTGTHDFTVPDSDSNGHPFKYWNTGETSTTITVALNGTYTAYYQAKYTLIITTTTGGTTNPPPGTYTLWDGTPVIVMAFPDANHVFDHWELDGSLYYSNPIDLTMDSDHTLHAVFEYSIPVGGVVSPVDKFGLLIPYIALAIAIVAITIGAMYARKRWLVNRCSET